MAFTSMGLCSDPMTGLSMMRLSMVLAAETSIHGATLATVGAVVSACGRRKHPLLHLVERTDRHRVLEVNLHPGVAE